MYEAYFTRRLLEAPTLADEADDAGERCVHLKASRYYRDLLEFPEKRRSIRHPTHIQGTVRHGMRWRRTTVTDLSTSGFRITLHDRVSTGSPLALQMDGLAAIEGVVVWQAGDQVGCKFATEIHPALVDAAVALGEGP